MHTRLSPSLTFAPTPVQAQGHPRSNAFHRHRVLVFGIPDHISNFLIITHMLKVMFVSCDNSIGREEEVNLRLIMPRVSERSLMTSCQLKDFILEIYGESPPWLLPRGTRE